MMDLIIITRNREDDVINFIPSIILFIIIYIFFLNESIDGSTCINNEDFNGTIIGTFKCPLDGFNDDDIYCCGPVGYQYCCKFFDS